LDGLSDVVEKAPQVKILNLSKNQVRRGNHLKFRLKVGGSAHWGKGKRKIKVPLGKGGVFECRAPGVFPSLELPYQFPVFLS
jgi:hypothetical protein